MKTILLFTFGILAGAFANAQSASLAWAHQIQGSPAANEGSMVTDVAGNVYTTASFTGTVDFDPGPDSFKLSSPAGAYSAYILKLDATGKFAWVKLLSGTKSVGGYTITFDRTGNIYVGGNFQGTADFDPGSGTSTLTCKGTMDPFILKLDASGNFAWVRQLETSTYGFCVSIALDTFGGIYASGYFTDSIDFDPGVGKYVLKSAGQYDGYLLKLNSSGNFAWAKHLGGSLDDYAFSVAPDIAGNIYCSGDFTGTVDFDQGSGTFNMTSNSNSLDMFILKLDASGNFTWATRFGSSSLDHPYSIQGDAAGNLYVTGTFTGIIDFDPGAGVSEMTAVGYDIFVLKLSSSGNFDWARRMGGAGEDNAFSIVVDRSGNAYTTGSFDQVADFDPGSGTYNLTPAGNFDVFMSKLDAAGNFRWARRMGGIGIDRGYSITLDKDENVYTHGFFTGTIDFDVDSGVANSTSVKSYDIFIHKMNQHESGLDKNSYSGMISIYPNPADGIFHVLLPGMNMGTHIEIYNTLGVLVYRQSMINEISAIDLSAYAGGLYVLNVLDDKQLIATRKIIKQ